MEVKQPRRPFDGRPIDPHRHRHQGIDSIGEEPQWTEANSYLMVAAISLAAIAVAASSATVMPLPHPGRFPPETAISTAPR